MHVRSPLRGKPVKHLLAVLALLSAQPAAAEQDMLTLDHAQPTLVENFSQALAWRSGVLDTNAPAKPLNDPSFSWAPGYIWNHAIGGVDPIPHKGKPFPAWTSNTNANADPNGDMIAQMGPEHAPLKWTGTLDFIADKMPPALAATIVSGDPKGYMGASITSFPYAQRYGVFAMVAKLPKGKGIWPAFWLLPVNKTWPPEIDVMELLGSDPSTFYTTLHLKGPKGHEAKGFAVHTQQDLSADFHEYALDWGPQTITWYFDRKKVFSQPTPDTFNQPFYLLANVAVGLPNNWGGAPDASTALPATMQVKSIHAWQRPEYTAAP